MVEIESVRSTENCDNLSPQRSFHRPARNGTAASWTSESNLDGLNHRKVGCRKIQNVCPRHFRVVTWRRHEKFIRAYRTVELRWPTGNTRRWKDDSWILLIDSTGLETDVVGRVGEPTVGWLGDLGNTFYWRKKENFTTPPCAIVICPYRSDVTCLLKNCSAKTPRPRRAAVESILPWRDLRAKGLVNAFAMEVGEKKGRVGLENVRKEGTRWREIFCRCLMYVTLLLLIWTVTMMFSL